MRVQQSDTPVCEVIVTKTDGKNYTVTTHFFDQTVKITDYKFDILDRANKNTIVDTRQNTNGTFVYQFQNAGTFAIQNTYLTEDDKQGQCESDDIQVGASDFDITYTTYAKSSQSPQFQKVVNE